MKLLMICTMIAILSSAPGLASAADDAAPPKLLEVRLTRSGDGTGAGPEDELVLRSNGTALFVGTKNVERIGLYAGDIPDHGFARSFPLLEQMYASIHAQRGSTGKPTQNVTAVHWRVIWDGKIEEIDDLCPGIDLNLWEFEMAVRGVAADVAWKAVDKEKAGPEPAGTQPARPELKLAPSAAAPAESVLDALTASAWVSAGPINILGQGATRTLRFTRRDGGDIRSEAILHTSKGFNNPDKGAGRTEDQTETENCQVRGPVLWTGGRPQTFAVVKGRSLVLNAMVPAGKGGGKMSWYYAACDRDKGGKAVRVEEYLFDFLDDPFAHDAGKGVMRARVGNYPPKADDMRFTLTRVEAGARYLKIDVDGPYGVAHRARIALIAGADYGLMLDNPNLDTRIFTAAP